MGPGAWGRPCAPYLPRATRHSQRTTDHPMRLRALLLIALSLSAGVLAPACGYRIVGHGAGGGRSLWIAPVPDESTEPLFGPALGAELNRQAVDRGDLALVRRGAADAHLTVTLEGISEAGAAFVAGDRVREYVLTGEVAATLSTPTGEVLWKGSGIRADREFPAGAGVNETRVNKDRALALLARDLAREVLRRASLALETAP